MLLPGRGFSYVGDGADKLFAVTMTPDFYEAWGFY